MAEKEKLPMGIEDFEEMRKCTLFDGLEISTETELCGRYMGRDKAGKKHKRRLTGDFINIRTGGFIWDFL